jgi:DNA invertase Pin-like site-specific DNA recombinase
MTPTLAPARPALAARDELRPEKIGPDHLDRLAVVYVRQSTPQQVLDHQESTRLQYGLVARARAWGWPADRVLVIDDDLGRSGASAEGRAGFQRLVAEVGLGHVGLILGVEMARLARSNADWRRLLEVCALFGALLADLDGVYDPGQYNDRLLLGLKGTMSEAELHVLKARLRGGILNQARRGALKLPLPVGLAYRDDGQVVLDPDEQIQGSLHLLFATFRRTGSASATARHFQDQELGFPRRVRTGPHRGEVVWQPLQHSTVLDVLHNPRYAGAFVFGRTRTRPTADGGSRVTVLPRDEWFALMPGAHAGYIAWDEYEENQRRLRENAAAHRPGPDRQPSPPREGPALLQGLAICGRCGERMGIHYRQRRGRLVPEYVCQRATLQRGQAPCQRIIGEAVDGAIGALLVRTVTPLALEAALAVEAELVARAEAADQLRQQRVARARYEADLAQRRFLRVDPANRLVADVLEADWNAKLRALAAAREEAERSRAAAQRGLSEDERAAIRALAADFPRLWADPRTPERERKRMARLLLEDVTLRRGDDVVAQVRFRGGATETLTLPPPPGRRTDPAVVAAIDRLLDDHTDAEVAGLLNAAGHRSHDGKPFRAPMVLSIRQHHRLPDHFSRLRARGLVTGRELAALLGVGHDTVERWRDRGYLRGKRANDRREWLYEPPGAQAPVKWKHKPPLPPAAAAPADGAATPSDDAGARAATAVRHAAPAAAVMAGGVGQLPRCSRGRLAQIVTPAVRPPGPMRALPEAPPEPCDGGAECD